AGAGGGDALRDGQHRSHVGAERRRTPGLHHGVGGCPTTLARRPANRRWVGALRCCRRAGASDRLRSPDPDWVIAALPAVVGRDSVAFLPHTRKWSMIEVMLLGVLVALTKIADYATVLPGVALFALGALVFVLAAMQSSFDPREVWNRVQWVSE